MKDWPEPYSCKFLEAGVVSYEDSGAGIALLKKETIDRMAPSFIGKPVVIDHQSVTPDNIDKHAVGYVTRVWFNPADGWFYCDFIITSDEAKRCIDEHGYSVSCAYNVLNVETGGLWHDIKYDGEITDGSFTHLALVEQPRYEESKITKQLPAMLVNGKAAHYINQEEDQTMFAIFKKKADGSKQDLSDAVVVVNGKEVKVQDLIKHQVELEKKNDKEQKYMAKDTDVVDINGHTYTIADLKNSFVKNEKKDEEKDEKKTEEKENASDDKDEKGEKKTVEKDEKTNESKEEDKDDKDKEMKDGKKNEKEESKEETKENSKGTEGDKFFVELQNASKHTVENEGPASAAPRTRKERADAWAKRNNKEK